MTSDAGSQSSPPAADPKPGGEEGRIRSLDDRFGAIEQEQTRQGGILERIEQALGRHPAAPPGGGASPEPSAEPAGPSVAEQVRQGVAKIEAQKKKDAEAQAARDADAAWRKTVEERLPERKPAEPATGRKARLQAFLVGKPDDR